MFEFWIKLADITAVSMLDKQQCTLHCIVRTVLLCLVIALFIIMLCWRCYLCFVCTIHESIYEYIWMFFDLWTTYKHNHMNLYTTVLVYMNHCRFISILVFQPCSHPSYPLFSLLNCCTSSLLAFSHCIFLLWGSVPQSKKSSFFLLFNNFFFLY